MFHFLEQILKERGKRVLIVGTSGSDKFGLTRSFYHKLGFRKKLLSRTFGMKGKAKLSIGKD
ncbi:MAG TPA: hypothetical protein VG847_09110 [Chitinophagaceae bacterium]|nr:hypothetical protein [Chitinophagaceae bacterium]